ncbi:MAG: hypothetical protein SF028_09900 [Candidatus Sumerlaeia bacterium]|nr:hypothetical protein [Candidatus Sumerlaeia bacterium]
MNSDRLGGVLARVLVVAVFAALLGAAGWWVLSSTAGKSETADPAGEARARTERVALPGGLGGALLGGGVAVMLLGRPNLWNDGSEDVDWLRWFRWL